jgi:hypothetical protein
MIWNHILKKKKKKTANAFTPLTIFSGEEKKIMVTKTY